MRNLTSFRDTTIEWVEKNQKEIEAHPAWYQNISPIESEILLKGANPFTYLLRLGQEKYAYFISFVKEDGSVKHQFFVLEMEKNRWCYRNGVTRNAPTEVRSQDLNELIPAMMHCDPSSCVCLSNKSEDVV